ncbi:MAG: Holliday junction branch migration protein RuvA [Acidobacteria bacterium]|jgi:Holliday junction DNA helicase RuvA|nr:Holliday junction branch migration protein RuvA [Acidobacteriota bacterium]
MIAAVRGKVYQLSPGRAAVETGSGVILQLLVPVSSFQRLRQGQDVLLYTVLKVKDEDIVIYGFLSEEEKALFEKLVAVSGIGGKTALACVSALAPGEWRTVIAAGDVARISAIPGIGRKTAQRIILELTGKLEAEPAEAATATRLGADLVSGLVNLGYPPRAARETVQRVLKENPGREDFEGLFKAMLKKVKP